jgi:hypothetical protein
MAHNLFVFNNAQPLLMITTHNRFLLIVATSSSLLIVALKPHIISISQGRFSGFKFALNPFNPSFKVRYIDKSVDVCQIQLDVAPPVQELGTQPVHARATARQANELQWQSS